MKNKIPQLIISAALTLGAASLVGQVTVNSGDWADTSIWSGGTVPTNTFTISGAHEVTMNNGDTLVSSNNSNIEGILNIEAGSSLQIARMIGEPGGTVNVNGGSFEIMRYDPANNNAAFTLNLNGGTARIADEANASAMLPFDRNATFNLNAGELRVINPSLQTAVHSGTSSNRAIHLNAGANLIFENFGTHTTITETRSLTVGGSWTGGTLTTNTRSVTETGATRLLTSEAGSWSSNANNVLALSSYASAQTFTVVNANINASQGILAFRIYSSNQNDNDQFVMNGATLTLTSGVQLQIEGFELAGNPEDYWGQTYQLFSAADYATITPSISSTTLDIDGITHNVTWSPQGDGSYMLIPEPGTYAMMFGALALALVILRRRFS